MITHDIFNHFCGMKLSRRLAFSDFCGLYRGWLCFTVTQESNPNFRKCKVLRMAKNLPIQRKFSCVKIKVYMVPTLGYTSV